ncbi:MAG TPA: hypothetical protein VGZ93_03375 [Candidatus Methylacidiphilales bacterium]|jgi:hypothetical protein|nr:hypothetical protein [Candidatus Methylacidiphilales bacterium]
MTLTALKKEALQLPAAQRIKLANAVFESLPPAREALSFAERERRAEEALSSSVKMIGADEFHEGARKLVDKIARRRSLRETSGIFGPEDADAIEKAINEYCESAPWKTLKPELDELHR